MISRIQVLGTTSGSACEESQEYTKMAVDAVLILSEVCAAVSRQAGYEATVKIVLSV